MLLVITRVFSLQQVGRTHSYQWQIDRSGLPAGGFPRTDCLLNNHLSSAVVWGKSLICRFSQVGDLSVVHISFGWLRIGIQALGRQFNCRPNAGQAEIVST